MIEINNLTNFRVDKAYCLGVAKKVLKGENKIKENLSVAFVSAKEMHELNLKYRKKDKPTDVLAFEKVSEFKDEHAEVVICPEYIREHPSEDKLSLKMELTKRLIHGILHVLGYDHERSEKDHDVMEQKEKEYFSKI